MKIQLLILSFIFVVACSSKKTEQTYTAITYNIRYDNPDDGADNWHQRKKELTEQIQQHKPDILGTQEALVHQVVYLDSALTNYNYVGVGREDGKTKGEYTALFYNKNKWKCLQSKTFWLSETPDTISIGWDAALERICTYALLENKENGEKLWALNVHFDHQGIEARQKAAELLVTKIADLQRKNAAPALLMGDFNAIPQDTPIKILTETLSDSFTKAAQAGNTATFNDFDLEKRPQHRIDYIFTKDVKVTDYKILTEKRKNGHYISDHFAVLCSFEIP